MNRYIMIFPIALLILSGPGIVSQAFATTTMTLETDSHVYDHASVIIVTGNIDPVDPVSYTHLTLPTICRV